MGRKHWLQVGPILRELWHLILSFQSTTRGQTGLSDFTNYASQGPELPRQPLFGGEALQGDVLEWKALSYEMQVLHWKREKPENNFFQMSDVNHENCRTTVYQARLLQGKFGWIKPLQPIDHPLAVVCSEPKPFCTADRCRQGLIMFNYVELMWW